VSRTTAVACLEGGGVEVDGGGVLEGCGVKVDSGSMTMTKRLRKRMAAARSEAEVEAAACSGARDKAAACSRAGIEDGRW
jgi:hypothetical protein